MVDKAFGASTFASGSRDGACIGVAGIIAGSRLVAPGYK